MVFADRQAEGAARFRSIVEPVLVPGERLLGVVFAPRKATFSGKMFLIATTDQRLVLIEVDRKMTAAKAPPISIRSSEITRSSIDGRGDGWATFVKSLDSMPDIRFQTANEKYVFTVMGGLMGQELMGADYMDGLTAACEFIWTATH